MLNEFENRVRGVEIIVAYLITLYLGIFTAVIYRNQDTVTYAIAIVAMLLRGAAAYIPIRRGKHLAIFTFFTLAACIYWQSSEMGIILLLASLILCCFPTEPDYFKLCIVVCSLISILLQANFTPMLLLFIFLLFLDMFLDLREYARECNWGVACLMHQGRAYWMKVSLAAFIFCTLIYIFSFKEA